MSKSSVAVQGLENLKSISDLNGVKKLVEKGELYNAISLLKILIERYHGSFIMFDLLVSLGATNFAIGEIAKAIVYLTEAQKYGVLGPNVSRYLYLARREMGLF